MTIDPTQTPIPADDQPTLTLLSAVVHRHGADTIELIYDNEKLSDHRFLVEHRLHQLGEYRIRLPDFHSDGKTFVMNGLTVQADGSLVPWSRVEGAALSPTIARPSKGSEEFRFVALAVCSETMMVLAEPYPGILNTTMLTGGTNDDDSGTRNDPAPDPNDRSGTGTLTGG